jgi:hypothetical protein
VTFIFWTTIVVNLTCCAVNVWNFRRTERRVTLLGAEVEDLTRRLGDAHTELDVCRAQHAFSQVQRARLEAELRLMRVDDVPL